MSTKITLSGFAGTGKSTVGKLLAEKLGYNFVSVGNFSREFAQKEFGLSINEFQEKCKQQPELDDLIDEKFKTYCNEHDKIVADYRLGFHFVEKAFNVLLKVTSENAAIRLRNANRCTEQIAPASIEKRNNEMRNRFVGKYGVDFSNEGNYNLTIETDNLMPEEIANLIISKMQSQVISTANFHLTKFCNFNCKYCFARFNDILGKSLSKTEQFETVAKLAESSKFRKINFAGGEPTLVPHIAELIQYAKSLGFETSIVTNASRIDAEWVKNIATNLDILAVSVDSTNAETNLKIGSNQAGKILAISNLKEISVACHNFGVQLKINTVVSKFNCNECLTDFINELRPFRWKILQATKVDGQNDKDFAEVEISRNDFEDFCLRNKNGISSEIKVVAESNEMIKGSYVMIDCQGRFFNSSKGQHIYSTSILEIGIEKALQQMNYDFSKFVKREGNYTTIKKERGVL